MKFLLLLLICIIKCVVFAHPPTIHQPNPPQTTFRRSNFEKPKSKQSTSKQTISEQPNFGHSDLSEPNLKDLNFTSPNLRQSNLTQSNILNLKDLNLQSNPEQSSITPSNFGDQIDLGQSNFEPAALTQLNSRKSNLEQSNSKPTNTRQTNLRQPNARQSKSKQPNSKLNLRQSKLEQSHNRKPNEEHVLPKSTSKQSNSQKPNLKQTNLGQDDFSKLNIKRPIKGKNNLKPHSFAQSNFEQPSSEQSSFERQSSTEDIEQPNLTQLNLNEPNSDESNFEQTTLSQPNAILTDFNQPNDFDQPLPTATPKKQPKIYEMQIIANISNRFANTIVIHKLENAYNESLETALTTIIPQNAYITSFVMEIDGKNYTATIKGKLNAQHIYTEAAYTGRTAAHLEANSRDSNKFKISISLEPYVKATFYLTYEELLTRNGCYEITINIHTDYPIKNLLTKIFISEQKPLKSIKLLPFQSESELNATKVPIENETKIYQVDYQNSIIKFHLSPEKQKEISETLGLTSGLQGKFSVQYDVQRDYNGGEILLKDGYFVHFFAPDHLQPLPKHVIFILDASGSMMFQKIEQLKIAMNNIIAELKEVDLFHLVEFSNDVRVWNIINPAKSSSFPHLKNDNFWFSESQYFPIDKVEFPSACPVNEVTLNLTSAILERMDANGGTNVYEALRVGLKLAERENSAQKAALAKHIENSGQFEEAENFGQTEYSEQIDDPKLFEASGQSGSFEQSDQIVNPERRSPRQSENIKKFEKQSKRLHSANSQNLSQTNNGESLKIIGKQNSGHKNGGKQNGGANQKISTNKRSSHQRVRHQKQNSSNENTASQNSSHQITHNQNTNRKNNTSYRNITQEDSTEQNTTQKNNGHKNTNYENIGNQNPNRHLNLLFEESIDHQMNPTHNHVQRSAPKTNEDINPQDIQSDPDSNGDENFQDLHQPLIIFLTDGEPTVGITDLDEIVLRITAQNTLRVPIFSLSFGDGADREFLKRISLENYGFSRHIYEAADAALQLQNFYKEVSSPLLTNVVFKYTEEAKKLTKTVFPIYFAGAEFVVAGYVDDIDEFGKSPKVTGLSVRGPVKLRPHFQASTGELERLWAFFSIKELLRNSVPENQTYCEDLAMELALKYSFVTPLTSLVVVMPNEDETMIDFESENLAFDDGDGLLKASMPIQLSSMDLGIMDFEDGGDGGFLDGLVKDFHWIGEVLDKHNSTLRIAGSVYVVAESLTDGFGRRCENFGYHNASCTLLHTCSKIRPVLISLEDYERNFCVINGIYAGVCCPD